MASSVDASGNPIPTSAVLMAASKHIGLKCQSENLDFLKCKKKDPNPEKCLDQGREVTRCVLNLRWREFDRNLNGNFLLAFTVLIPCILEIGQKGIWAVDDVIRKYVKCFVKHGFYEQGGAMRRLKDLHKKCTKEMDEYVGCMYYYTNEFEMCRKEQQAFEKACPLE